METEQWVWIFKDTFPSRLKQIFFPIVNLGSSGETLGHIGVFSRYIIEP
jgi:hypothetical protein